MIALAAIQPTFLPWRGFFDIIHQVDIFIHYDDAQYSRESWRNRNRIKTQQGSQWLTVPVLVTGHSTDRIDHIYIDHRSNWQRKHLETIRHSYRKAPFFDQYFPALREIYQQPWEKISDFDIHLTEQLATWLGIHVKWVLSSELGLTSCRTDRLIEVCQHYGATHYRSGPSAQSYIELEKFDNAGITLEYQEYNYRPYPQLHGAFDPYVSVIDLLFNCGAEAPNYIWDCEE